MANPYLDYVCRVTRDALPVACQTYVFPEGGVCVPCWAVPDAPLPAGLRRAKLGPAIRPPFELVRGSQRSVLCDMRPFNEAVARGVRAALPDAQEVLALQRVVCPLLHDIAHGHGGLRPQDLNPTEFRDELVLVHFYEILLQHVRNGSLVERVATWRQLRRQAVGGSEEEDRLLKKLVLRHLKPRHWEEIVDRTAAPIVVGQGLPCLLGEAAPVDLPSLLVARDAMPDSAELPNHNRNHHHGRSIAAPVAVFRVTAEDDGLGHTGEPDLVSANDAEPEGLHLEAADPDSEEKAPGLGGEPEPEVPRALPVRAAPPAAEGRTEQPRPCWAESCPQKKSWADDTDEMDFTEPLCIGGQPLKPSAADDQPSKPSDDQPLKPSAADYQPATKSRRRRGRGHGKHR